MCRDIISLIVPFMPMFSKKVWLKVQVLLIGAILCRGKRTVTSILRVMDLGKEKKFCNYHRVLSRAKWSALFGAKILFGLLILLVPESWPIILIIDETIERRKGEKIKAKGVYRDGVKSTGKAVVKCFGLKWISMMMIIVFPWSTKCWTLPFLTVLAPSKKASKKVWVKINKKILENLKDKMNVDRLEFFLNKQFTVEKLTKKLMQLDFKNEEIELILNQFHKKARKKHKTTVDWTIQMIKQVRRWEKSRKMFLVGDGAYSCVKLANTCIKENVKLVTRLRLDSRLYEFAPEPDPHKRGPKPSKGERLTPLKDLVGDKNQNWKKGSLVWYGQEIKTIEYLSGTCLWYREKQPPAPIQWILVRDPEGKIKTEAFFTTDLDLDPVKIVQLFVWRWGIETTFQECREHLGFETQRQWSDKAIERTSPAILALFSIICIMALKLSKNKKLLPENTVWYRKGEATFSDVLVFVRQHLWNKIYLKKSTLGPDLIYFSFKKWENLVAQLAGVA